MELTPPTLAVSTSWRAGRQSLAEILDPIRELGIRRVELNSLPPGLFAGLPGALAERGMAVQSLHLPCPFPVDAAGVPLPADPDYLASPDGAERAQGLAWGRATIDWARRLGARAVIVHLGHVAVPGVQGRMFELVRAGRLDELAALRREALAEREARKGPYLRSALASIRQLGEWAAEAGVALGVEVRDHYHEIPSLAEFAEVWAVADGLPIGYWHDAGHAEKHRHLGLATHEDYIGRCRGRVLGVHLHDAVLDHDHRAPGCGEIDLATLAGLLPAGILRTLELNRKATPEEVRAGIDLLARLGLA